MQQHVVVNSIYDFSGAARRAGRNYACNTLAIDFAEMCQLPLKAFLVDTEYFLPAARLVIVDSHLGERLITPTTMGGVIGGASTFVHLHRRQKESAVSVAAYFVLGVGVYHHQSRRW